MNERRNESLSERLRRLVGLGGTVPAQPPGMLVPTPKQLRHAPKPVTRFAADVPVLPLPATNRPRISFVMIVYSMPEQAQKTLYSLSLDYQRGVGRDDYEVIVVENASSRMFGEQAAMACNANVRYFCRDDGVKTPVPALNFGADQAEGSHIAYMIDGARLLSPGVVNYMINAAALAPRAVVAVPGYHLGNKLQQEAMLEGYDEHAELLLMQSIDWPDDGYRLFDIACLSGTCAGGYFKPIGESNCFCVPQDVVGEVGGYDSGFTETGGGQVNLDFYKRVVEVPDTTLVVLLGEGSFHQFHGGITTGQKGELRRDIMEAHFAQYYSLRGGAYEPPEKRAIYLGTVPDAVLKFIRHGANKVITVNELE